MSYNFIIKILGDIMNLSPQIKAKLRAQLTAYHNSLWTPPLSGELEFLDRTVSSLNNLKISAPNQLITTRSKRVHLSPKVSFSKFLFPTNLITKELADLVLVYKHFVNGVLSNHRATLVQSKYTPKKRRSWRIDADQFFLMTQWPIFKIVSPKRFKNLFHVRPRTLTWSTYGFVGALALRFPVYFSSARILRLKTHIPLTKTFSFGLQTPSGWDSSPSFLMKFLQGLVGENLLKNKSVKDLIRTLYILADWEVDPPDELERNFEKPEENKGFGIVEFTVRTEDGTVRD